MDDVDDETTSSLGLPSADLELDEPLPDLSAGTVLGSRFRLEQELARPRGTLTWRAFDLKLHRAVLVHVMAPEGRRTPAVLSAALRAAVATDSRFLRVLDAVDAGPDDPGSFIVCEYAPGRSLQELLDTGPLSALEAAWVVREVADAMAPMHAQGIFHERLNPDTVIITATGNVKIVGLLIEAALHPVPGDAARSWSDREASDVHDLGRLLYASLVTRWPLGSPQRPLAVPSDPTDPRMRTWGLSPAPADAHGWLTPRQVRAGVSPALDVLCDQILSDFPRHDEVPIRTANEVDQALTRVLGSADAAADLERRLRYPVPPRPQRVPRDTDARGDVPHHDPRTTAPQPVVDWLDDDDDGTGTSVDLPPVSDPPDQPAGRDEDGYWTPQAAAGQWADLPARTGARASSSRRPTGSATAPGSGGQSAASPSTGHVRDLTRPRPRDRRWPFVLIAVTVVVLVLGLVLVGLHQRSTTTTAPSPTPSGPVHISKVDDFDPSADGGNDEENPDQVARAWDGSGHTVWRTLVYRGSARLGGLKPGVGLVVDLGTPTRVSSVDVTLTGSGTDVSLWRPTTTASTPPMGTIKSWTRLSARSGATSTTRLTPSTPVTTRYLLVYLTSLPQVSSGRYQGGIAEITVHP